MNMNDLPDNPYLLLTPGPLSTTKTVKGAMLRDWCTWDSDYNNLVQEIRARLVKLATKHVPEYTAVLMQGSGTFSVEAVIGSAVPREGKLLVLANGAYGSRIAQIAQVLGIATVIQDSGETSLPSLDKLEEMLARDQAVTHVAVVHCETTTGILNPIADIGEIVKKHDKVFIVDAMSSFGGMEMDISALNIDFLISSANKCLQGVPGFGLIIARTRELLKCGRRARSLSLDLYDQWETMEKHGGKWRYTSPTHVVRAFYQALLELEEEGGIPARSQRYRENQRCLAEGMAELGFQVLLDPSIQSPIITSFYFPDHPDFRFTVFYQTLKEQGFVIYPGKISHADTFRIGNIGDVHLEDIKRLLLAVKNSCYWVR
ncbi:2-aminoethylphosphonate--pyruvate transaminase [Candidatus Formimonas warabiya]|uniref:2-aminoethylphosphonate--pyruvate transaminase n=1 Tax=Formimonas warabiya TaxID=1761012 RepID=A0A3G1KVX7_FORW1|nr:2-aminoethylphosphonate--pyruvate transaminase [Candidatus Formimonas warabiya]ATW26648.1 2-aminoethylphosphonate--pyruvate transaminase [Candidatus Formimonas warabiya]